MKMKMKEQSSGMVNARVVTCHFSKKKGLVKKDYFHY
jgi:hypothetical protein